MLSVKNGGGGLRMLSMDSRFRGNDVQTLEV
jgi:hypothetical protein